MLLYRDGALAQLGARIAGSDEVTGSSPVRSTIRIGKPLGAFSFMVYKRNINIYNRFMNYIYTSLISYLLGTFNIAYIIAKAHGFDIRERGSKNAGASNMKVNFGWGAGVLTALCDMAKSFIAVKLCSYLFPGDELIPFVAGAMAIIGHIFPFYMGFRGGKGFASYIGMVLALDFKLGLAIAVLIIIVALATNYIVLSTFMTITVVPLYYIYKGARIEIVLILVAIAALIFYKHRMNIKRLLHHEEMVIFDRSKKKKTEE